MYRTILIDGRHLLYRAADVMRDLGLEEGEGWTPTGAIYGFIKTVMALWERVAAEGCWLCVCWEGGKLFRRSLYDDYKRKGEPDPELRQFLDGMDSQEKLLKGVLSLAGISQAVATGYEADDVMATLATRMEKLEKFRPVAIYTGDADLHQCVTESVHVISPSYNKASKDRDKVWLLEDVVDRWRVQPERIPEFKGLSGDGSDHIPGVKGIGEGWARKLLTTYKSLDDLLKDARKGTVSGVYEGKEWSNARIAGMIAEQHEMMYLSAKLATVVPDAPIHFLPTRSDERKLIQTFQAFRFHTMLRPTVLAKFKEMNGDG